MTDLERLNAYEHFQDMLIQSKEKPHTNRLSHLMVLLHSLKIEISELQHILGDPSDSLAVDENGAFLLLKYIVELAKLDGIDYDDAKRKFLRAYVSGTVLEL